eukprot:1159012-Pelagomonas_calceolata.AAC.2
MKSGMEAQVQWLSNALNDANARIAAEEAARQQADEHLQTWFDQNQVSKRTQLKQAWLSQTSKENASSLLAQDKAGRTPKCRCQSTCRPDLRRSS